MNGGYILLDCKGLDLTGGSTPQTIAGSWESAKTALKSGKPIVAENCVYGTGVPVSPVTCFGWYISTTEIVIVGATLHIHVKNDNTCIVIDVASTTANRTAKK